MSGREIRAGQRFQIVRIDQPDPDHYAVIYYRGGAFGCSRDWFDRNRPVVGGSIVMGTDGHWHVETPEAGS